MWPVLLPRKAACLLLLLAIGSGSACGRQARMYTDGAKRSEGRISPWTGLEDGFWIYWYPNGALREQGRYENGRRVGLWEQWYSNGQRRSFGERRWNEHTHGSEREGIWTFWHDIGTKEATGMFRAGKREGHWDYSLDNGGFDGDRTGEYYDDFKID